MKPYKLHSISAEEAERQTEQQCPYCKGTGKVISGWIMPGQEPVYAGDPCLHWKQYGKSGTSR